MPESKGLTDFFSMEASEYLDRLDGVVSKGAAPPGDEFLRLARSLRGSALMAHQQAIAETSGGLEQLARAVREGRRPWDPATKQLAIRAVDDLKILVRKIGSWGPSEDAKARQLAAELQQAAGGAAAPVRPSPPAGVPDPGTRAFLAQQGAALASVVDRAATELAQHPTKPDVLQVVLKSMQPLRGIAGLADYPPLPDLLEGLERGIAELRRRAQPGGDSAALFHAAGKAIARAAREVAAAGKADPDAPEAREFARLLGVLFDLQVETVPIESLYYADAGPHIVQQGTAAARPAQLSNLELVAHGEHLRQAADALERAQSAAQRELRAHALASTFNALASMGAGVFGTAVSAFARAARSALAAGTAARDTTRFVDALRAAAGVLTSVGREDDAALARRLSEVTGGLAAASAAATAQAPTRPPADAPAAPDAGVPRRPAAISVAQPVASAAVGAMDAEAAGGLAASFSTFERYLALGAGPAALEELLAGPPAAPVAASASAPRAGAAADAAETIVPIAELCYSGPAAIERALSLRAQVRAALASKGADGAVINDLLEEIFDLVQLGTGHKP